MTDIKRLVNSTSCNILKICEEMVRIYSNSETQKNKQKYSFINNIYLALNILIILTKYNTIINNF